METAFVVKAISLLGRSILVSRKSLLPRQFLAFKRRGEGVRIIEKSNKELLDWVDPPSFLVSLGCVLHYEHTVSCDIYIYIYIHMYIQAPVPCTCLNPCEVASSPATANPTLFATDDTPPKAAVWVFFLCGKSHQIVFLFGLPSGQLLKVWRWFSISQGRICSFPEGYAKELFYRATVPPSPFLRKIWVVCNSCTIVGRDSWRHWWSQ